MAQHDDLKRSVPSSPSVATPLGATGIRGRVTGVTRIGSRAGLIAIAAVATLVFAIFYGISTSGSHPHDTSAAADVPQVLSTSAPLYANVPGAIPTAAALLVRRAALQPVGHPQPVQLPASPQSANAADSQTTSAVPQATPVLPQTANDNALQATANVPDPRALAPVVPALRGAVPSRVVAPQAVATPNAAAIRRAERERESMQVADQARHAAILVLGQNAQTVAGVAAPPPVQTAAYAGSSAGNGAATGGAAVNGTAASGSDVALRDSTNPAAAGQTYDPNVYAQRAKNDFINAQKSTTANDYLTAPRQASISPYEVQAGSIIPATLLTGINSDLPGTLIGQVSQNVYDSKTGRYLLIPAGAKVVGRYDSQVTSGQRRVIVAWQRIIYPDASFIDINGLGGADTAGYSGLTGKVDDHSGKLFRNAILASLIGAGTTLLQPRNLAVLTPAGMVMQTTAASQVAGQVANGVSQAAAQVSGNGVQQQPTIEVRPGYLFNIMVDRDLVLPGPYGR